MLPFIVSEEASEEIKRILLDSGCDDPVARLYEKLDVGRGFNDFRSQLLKGTWTIGEWEREAKKRLDAMSGGLNSSLVVTACERAEFQPEELCFGNGMTFALSVRAMVLLRGYRLTFERGEFLLRDADNVSRTLRSLAN